MRQSISIRNISGFIAVFLFVFTNNLLSQQRIQIKEGTADVGHFSVELLKNANGAPMKSFSGSDGEIFVDSDNNNFILRLRNLTWYTKEEELDLNIVIDQISAMTDCDISFAKSGSELQLKSIKSIITDIHFNVNGIGQVKLAIPFTYKDGGSGRFLQDFTIKTEKETKEEDSVGFASKSDESKPRSRADFRKIWNEVDETNKIEVAQFILDYKDEDKAKVYIKQAAKLIDEFKKEKELSNAKINSTSKNKSESAEIFEQLDEELTTDSLVSDIKEIVDSIDFDIESDIDDSFVLGLQYEGEMLDEIEVFNSEMPLQLNFQQSGEVEDQLLNAIPIYNFSSDTLVSIDKELLKSHRLKGEFNSFKLLNAQGVEVFESSINIDTTGNKESNSLLYILTLSGLLIAFGGFVVFNKKRKEKIRQKNKKELKAKIEANQQKLTEQNTVKTHVSDTPPNASVKSKSKIVIGAKQSNKEKLVPVSSVPRSNSTGRIKIKSRKKSGVSIDYNEFVEVVNEYDTVNVDLSKIWNDTKIRNVYLASEFINDLDTFLADSSNDGIQNELQGAIPEVGGFMMGRFTEKDSFLEVLVEKFVPFVPEYNDVFKIEIGTKTIVDELGDAQDKNPKLEVIGWFHTHPGHGLFLSTSDLSVQRHFPNDYQVAMEIDSLTKGLDMAIFTRKNNGRMNNSNDRIENRGWFNWVDIENSNVSKL